MADENKLYRSTSDAMLGGVAGGLAKYFGVDSTLVRLILLLFIFAGGIGFFVYIAAWIFIPPESGTGNAEGTRAEEVRERIINGARRLEQEVKEVINGGNASAEKTEVGSINPETKENWQDERQKRQRQSSYTAGLLLITIGIILLGDNIFPWLRFEQLWPLILIVLGACVFFKGFGGDR